LAKVIPTLFGDIQNNNNISTGRIVRVDITDQKVGFFDPLKYKKNAKSTDKIFRKQTLDLLNPWPLFSN